MSQQDCPQCQGTGIFVPRSVTVSGAGPSVTKHYPEQATTCTYCEGSGEQKFQRPFSCGTESMDWTDSNCYRCLKDYDEEAREHQCDLALALHEAWWGSGLVTLDQYRRLGLGIGRRCTEFVEKP